MEQTLVLHQLQFKIPKQTPIHQKNRKKDVRPINKHVNYDGTDFGFTSSSFSDQTVKD